MTIKIKHRDNKQLKQIEDYELMSLQLIEFYAEDISKTINSHL